MDRKDFDRFLAQGDIPSVLLFEGEEEHMKQTALDALQKRLLPEGLEDLNRTVLDAPETDQIIAVGRICPALQELSARVGHADDCPVDLHAGNACENIIAIQVKDHPVHALAGIQNLIVRVQHLRTGHRGKPHGTQVRERGIVSTAAHLVQAEA